MSSSHRTDVTLEDLEGINITLMTLRKPTELKKVIDSVPKPLRAVPKNGLPLWYRLGLECKLPVPKMPVGKIIFSRGKIGEDIRRLGLGEGPRPTFDLTDPYCNNVSYDYVAMHDPHLTHYFAQKPARLRMQQLGFCTKDNRAVCSLKEFNQYRKYLYNQFMDRIHMEIIKCDERAKDDLTLKRVAMDVSRRKDVFNRAEKAREHLEKVFQANADEWLEKKRLAKEQQKKVQARMKYLAEFNEKQRKERATRAAEKENRIKQRVQAAEELELRRKITMVRQWRSNEKKRVNRLKQEKEAKKKRLEDEANRKWMERVQAQNRKIQEEALLLKMYTEDMGLGAHRRIKKAEIYAYNTDLELQRIRLANWKAIHGGSAKVARLVWKIGAEFEKSKRGQKGMSMEVAQEMAKEAMAVAHSTRGDVLMTLGQARARMDIVTILPPAPVKILEEVLEHAVLEFARRRVHVLLQDVERTVRSRAELVFFNLTAALKKQKKNRYSKNQTVAEFELKPDAGASMVQHGSSIGFGDVSKIPQGDDYVVEGTMKSVKNRPPTPVPSLTKLAEVTFSDRVEDLTDPVSNPSFLPERLKTVEMVHTAGKILTKNVTDLVMKSIDVQTGKVIFPPMRHSMEWGEAVESIANAVTNNHVQADSANIRQTQTFLTIRVLKSLADAAKHEKTLQKTRLSGSYPYVLEDNGYKIDFYVPD